MTLVFSSPPFSFITKEFAVFIDEILTKLFLDMMNSLFPSFAMTKESLNGLNTSMVNWGDVTFELKGKVRTLFGFSVLITT